MAKSDDEHKWEPAVVDEETHLERQTQGLGEALRIYSECKVILHNANMAFINAKQELTRKLKDAGVKIEDLAE